MMRSRARWGRSRARSFSWPSYGVARVRERRLVTWVGNVSVSHWACTSSGTDQDKIRRRDKGGLPVDATALDVAVRHASISDIAEADEAVEILRVCLRGSLAREARGFQSLWSSEQIL